MAFSDTITRWLEPVRDYSSQQALRKILRAVGNTDATGALTSAALVIFGAASPLAKTGAAIFYALVNGTIQTIAAATSMPALVGTILTTNFNVYCFFIDGAGVVTSAMGTAGATLAKVVFPPFPEMKALVGFIIIHPTGAGSFVGGTTALDDASVIPNAVFISTTAACDPAILLG